MPSLVGTRVFATDGERNEIGQMLAEAQLTPPITWFDILKGKRSHPIWNAIHERTHRAARAHGLPEIEGYYGLDLRTGEFVTEGD
jgi:hypothetical protein